MHFFCFILCVLAVFFGGPMWLIMAICFWILLGVLQGISRPAR